MEKNYDGYYGCYNRWDDGYESSMEPVTMFEVQGNKVIYAVDGMDGLEKVKKIVGEDVRDVIMESINWTGEDVNYNPINEEYSPQVCKIGHNTYQDFKQKKLQEWNLSEQDYQKQIDSILQAKENKNTLGKTDTLRKIAGMKDRTGGK